MFGEAVVPLAAKVADANSYVESADAVGGGGVEFGGEDPGFCRIWIDQTGNFVGPVEFCSCTGVEICAEIDIFGIEGPTGRSVNISCSVVYGGGDSIFSHFLNYVLTAGFCFGGSFESDPVGIVCPAQKKFQTVFPKLKPAHVLFTSLAASETAGEFGNEFACRELEGETVEVFPHRKSADSRVFEM